MVTNINETLESIIADLDISPTDFETARKRYTAVANWLSEGVYQSGNNTDIYLQGSFRLGTVIRPYRNSENANFDIDQVCEISGNETTAGKLKQDVGNRLKENSDYARMLDKEGRRCWTIEYASTEGRPGFHIDILPSRPNNGFTDHIDITHKVETNYVWRSSNPKGYYKWFKERNYISRQLLEYQRELIYTTNKNIYESVDTVPKQLIRTPLQRSIQLMKRHRDVYFNDKNNSPISIIITTICTQLYNGQDIVETLNTFTGYVTYRLASVVGGETLSLDNILDYQDGKWIIKNPADEKENFADKWSENLDLAEDFFSWVFQLKRDITAFNASSNAHDLKLATTIPQAHKDTYGNILLNSMSSGRVGSNDPFLNLIHQGIEGRLPWTQIGEVARRNVEYEPEEDGNKDVAWVNYYQVKIHSGRGLSEQDISHIRNIIRKHEGNPAFIYCCNLLLGSATTPMLRDCIKYYREHCPEYNVLSWPITRLAKKQIAENSEVIIPVSK